MHEDYIPFTTVEKKDGSIERLFRCSCGTPVYKKEMRSGKYEFLLKPHKGQPRTLKIESDKCKLACPNPDCTLSHIVVNIHGNDKSN